ncbi:MAG TPA: hypothetical protein VNU01_06545 [Egibacteraceae bacterium]|nr:hypothetical protein [Egibacteraceae bacterium]
MEKRWRGRAARVAAGALAAMLLAACGGGTAGGDDHSPTATAEETEAAANSQVDKSRTYRAKVHAEGTGAAPFTWDGEQEVVLTRVGGPDIDVNLLSAGFAVPEIVTDDPAHRFRWAFDLLNAYEDQPGTFQITADPVNAQGLKSKAFLIWMKVKDEHKDKEAVFEMDEVEYLKEFNQLQEPCTVEVGPNESSGTLTCTALATAEGEVAGLTVTWEEIPG